MDLSKIFDMMMNMKMIDLIFGGGDGGGGMFGGGSKKSDGGIGGMGLSAILRSQADTTYATATTAYGVGMAAAPTVAAQQPFIAAYVAATQAWISADKTAALVEAMSGGGGESAMLAIVLAR